MAKVLKLFAAIGVIAAGVAAVLALKKHKDLEDYDYEDLDDDFDDDDCCCSCEECAGSDDAVEVTDDVEKDLDKIEEPVEDVDVDINSDVADDLDTLDTTEEE